MEDDKGTCRKTFNKEGGVTFRADRAPGGTFVHYKNGVQFLPCIDRNVVTAQHQWSWNQNYGVPGCAWLLNAPLYTYTL